MRLVAYYLPQYHSIPENDNWWGEGFTEWTNVKKAVPLFKGHYQPIIPGELGYYNILDPDIRERQAQMAQYAGIEAFCYWHYWFGKGKQLLEKPFNEVLKSSKPDLKFCLGWANEAWKAKVWSNSAGGEDKILINQEYNGTDDIVQHFYSLLDAFRDKRYLLVEEKPMFVIYRPLQLPDPLYFIKMWNDLAVNNGLKGIFFVGHTLYSSEVNKILKLGFDAVNVVRLGDCRRSKKLILFNLKNLFLYAIRKKPFVYNYKDAISELCGLENKLDNVFPSILSNWDHTPRSGKHGFLLHDSNPNYFRKLVQKVRASVAHKPSDRKIVFLKSWNEWGEGNYVEPDERFGSAYLEILREENLINANGTKR
jgi:hypothetical protein